MLLPADGPSVTRNNVRAIARAEVRDDGVMIVMVEPSPTTPPNTQMSTAHLLEQLAALPGESSQRSVLISAGLQQVDERYSVEVRNPVHTTSRYRAMRPLGAEKSLRNG